MMGATTQKKERGIILTTKNKGIIIPPVPARRRVALSGAHALDPGVRGGKAGGWSVGLGEVAGAHGDDAHRGGGPAAAAARAGGVEVILIRR